MSTMQVMINYPGPAARLIQLEAFLSRLLLSLVDWTVDTYRWSLRRVRNRRGYPRGVHHRTRGGQQESVWDILHRSVHEDIWPWQPSGRYRDSRGWRYKSVVWPIHDRLHAERDEQAYWEHEVNKLMTEIRYMLDNPPCSCGAVKA